MRQAAVAAMTLAAALACAGTGLAQQTAPQPSSGSSVIRGRVTAADNGRPLRRAQVTLTAPELGTTRRTANTSSEGRYEFEDLPAGRYTLSVVRSGYLSLRHGQRRPLEQARPLQVGERQTIDRVDFALPRMSVIAGRITDEVGDPMADVLVFAMRWFYFEGRRQLMPADATRLATDDAGRYRLSGLVPGTYAVMATTRETWTVTTGGKPQVMAFRPTYFPGTPILAQAKWITVGVGQAMLTADFALVPGRAASVAGTAFDSTGRPLQRVGLVQEFRSALGLGTASFGGVGADVRPDGTFIIRNLPAGDFVLRASNGAGERPETAAVPITIDGGDIDNLAVVTSAGWSASGQIVTESGTPPGFRRERMSITGRVLVRSNPGVGRGEIGEDWTFSIRDIPGRARLRVDLPDGWVLKGINHDGRDITDVPIELKSGEVLSPLEVVVSDRPSMMEGQLLSDKGAPLDDGTVIVYASDADRWFAESRFVRVARPDQQGAWQIRGLPPGDYRAVAVEYVEEGTWNDPEYLESLRRLSQPVVVSEGSSQTISLKVVK